MASIKKNLILIVDDNSKNLQVLGKILYEKGYNINVASSGAKALQSVNIQPPDLILLDIQMPEMDGFDVCKILKSNAKTKDIPVIFLTAATDTESIVKGFKLGGMDYITKPFNNEELIIRVNTHIDLRAKTLELQKINQNLEKIVEERTHQLHEYAFITSHNLRKPLANIIGFISILEQSIDKKEQFPEILKYLKNSSTELDNIIKETAHNLNKK
ncbi:MAG: hypothetical protein A2033_02945 [Bacteroidetes bacterium GWA2_31_9]|nr:MAG: hypothetical protein A2033_02945 [Bacteroidetes bacterium GWA2_31_9]